MIWMAFRSSAPFWGLFSILLSSLVIWSHKGSMMLRSGLILGHGMASMAAWLRNSRETRTVCVDAPSRMNKGRWAKWCPSMCGSTCVASSSSWYLTPVIFPRISLGSSFSPWLAQPHTDSDTPPDTNLGRMQSRRNLSPSCRQTRTRPSTFCYWKQDSSLQRTRPQYRRSYLHAHRSQSNVRVK